MTLGDWQGNIQTQATALGTPQDTKVTNANSDGSVIGLLKGILSVGGTGGGGGGGGGPVSDVVATGNLTTTSGAGSTIQLALGTGQATWEVQLTGTFSAGTVIAFQGSDDATAPTNWQPAVGYNAALTNPKPITQISGPGPFIIRGPAAGYQYVQVVCTALTGGDSVAVRLIGSTGALAGGGPVSVPDGANVVEGTTTDAAGANTLIGQAKQITTNTTGLATQSTLSAAKTDLDAIAAAAGATNDAAYTSGNGSLVALLKGIFGRLGLGQQNKSASLPVTLASDQGSLLFKGDFVEQAGLSAGALNADLVPSTDVSNFKWFSLQIVGGTWVGTLTFQGSNDNANWQNVQVASVGGNTSLVTSTTSNNFYHGSLDFRYFRVRMTAYTSGTALGVLELYTQSIASPQWTLPVSQSSGTWTVQPGNTANTTPWLVNAAVTAPVYASLAAQSGYVAAWGSNPTALTANTDASFKWGGSGTTVVNHIMLQNNTTLNVMWDLDVATSLGSPVLQPNQTIFLDVQTTALHLQANGTPALNGSSGSNIVVRAWL